MGEPEHQMHNYAFPPSVANWVQSTTLATTQPDGSTDEPSDRDPDAFYRPSLSRHGNPETSHYPTDMTASRVRQQTSNGAVRAAPKPAFRSASGPAMSTLSPTRSPPQNLPGSRTPVKSLAQKFDQLSPPEPRPSVPRVRPSRPAPASRSATSTGVSTTTRTTSTSPTARQPPSYGPHKFPNLKQRERPQPAPTSPIRARRTAANRSSLDEQTLSTRNVSSPVRSQQSQTSAARQPFFGEVIGDQNDVVTPGYGIPSMDSTEPEPSEMRVAPLAINKASRPSGGDLSLLPATVFQGPSPRGGYGKANSTMTDQSVADSRLPSAPESFQARTSETNSPRSRIPVPSRRKSTESSSSASTGSSRTGYMRRPVASQARTATTRKPLPTHSSTRYQWRAPGSTAPPPLSYREYRDAGMSLKGASNGAGLAAVITKQVPPSSPPLRNSRDRQLLPHGDPRARSRSTERFVHGVVDDAGHHSSPSAEPNHRPEEFTDDSPSEADTAYKTISNSTSFEGVDSQDQLDDTEPLPSPSPSPSLPAQPPLTLQTASLRNVHEQLQPSSSSDFEYEESPTLGMPGSFMETPPIPQVSPPSISIESEKENRETQDEQQRPVSELGELLPSKAFQPASKNSEANTGSQSQLHSASSELSLRESIPIMLGSDTHGLDWEASTRAPPVKAAATMQPNVDAWRANVQDLPGAVPYFDGGDSPIDPFPNRSTLRPDDSASVAFYIHLQRPSPEQTPRVPQSIQHDNLTLDSEGYSVINRVLELYHQSDVVTAEMASQVQQQVQAVSPLIAQHRDWDSKEATTTYLARLLSDVNANTPRPRFITKQILRVDNLGNPVGEIETIQVPVEDEPPRGTAIIFPSESRRYSRGSRGSAATTIWEDGSRADSSSVNQSREQLATGGDHHHHSRTSHSEANGLGAPISEWKISHTPSRQPSYPVVEPLLSQPERLSRPFTPMLPELDIVGGGLGLSLQTSEQNESARATPPIPAYTPPPPPGLPSIDQAAAQSSTTSYNSNGYGQGAASSMPPPRRDAGPRLATSAVAIDNTPAPSPTSTKASVTKVTIISQTIEPAKPAPAVNALGADPTAQALRRRLHVMKEILDTENAFACDMIVIDKMFRYTCDELLTDREERTLFGNSRELCEFADEFFTALKKATRPVGYYKQPLKAKSKAVQSSAGRARSLKAESEVDTAEGSDVDDKAAHPDGNGVAGQPKDNPRKPTLDSLANLTVENDSRTRIGATFLAHMRQIESVFKAYLLNHENANEFLKTIINDERIIGWQKACIAHAEGLTQAWDLDSLLVKPTQRIMKYPLLLAELKGATPPDHPDYGNIEEAHREILDITMRINMEKKKQETLRAATKEGKKKQKGKSGGIGEVKLSKNFLKAFSRKTDKIKQQAGLAEIFDDPDYNYQSQRFGGHFFQLQVALRDIEIYLEKLTLYISGANSLVMGFIGMLESTPTSPELESQWRRNAMTFLELQNKALEEHKADVQSHIIQPIIEVWKLYVSPQGMMEERKKGLPQYAKYLAAVNKGEKADKKLQESAERFIALNDVLKKDLPVLYTKTKTFIGVCLVSLIAKQKDWWMKCQRKIFPLLEVEPEHTTDMSHDMKSYMDRFISDFSVINNQLLRLNIANHSLLTEMSNLASPQHSYYSDDNSSRKSTSRRTHSLGSDMSATEAARRRSAGVAASRASESSQSFEPPPRSSPIVRNFAAAAASRAISPGSDSSDKTMTPQRFNAASQSSHNAHNAHSPLLPWPSLDGAIDMRGVTDNGLLSPPPPPQSSLSRASGIFTSALPMSDSPPSSSVQEPEPSPTVDQDEPEVLFLAASLFEFNIAHDRREGGIPYLVYVPGEIFDVIGMKGELWLARNQDDATRTVGWIWEKHFARILPEES